MPSLVSRLTGSGSGSFGPFFCGGAGDLGAVGETALGGTGPFVVGPTGPFCGGTGPLVGGTGPFFVGGTCATTGSTIPTATVVNKTIHKRPAKPRFITHAPPSPKFLYPCASVT